jgi:5-methylcytosine-specific restriction endonuclease McrA
VNLFGGGSIPLGHPVELWIWRRSMVASVLERPTLVLNRNWQPVGVATVAKALTKVWNNTARIVDPADYQQYSWEDWSQLRPADGDLMIQTRHFPLRVPEVVTLTKYDRLPSNAVTFSRRNVFKRDKFMCQYCGAQPGSEELTIDHVLPRAQGGTSTWTNCVLACIDCNSRKADRTPEQAKMPLRSLPVRPTWRPLYAARGVRIESWSRFISESYWNVELAE